jgi:E3 ubiquitin-protein ligase EDD1
MQDGQMPRFTHIAAMHSELAAINTNGQLCQWRWSDPEPFSLGEVNFVVRIL